MPNDIPPKVVDPNKPKRVKCPAKVPVAKPSTKPLGGAVDIRPVQDQNERLRRENEQLRKQLAESAPNRHEFVGGELQEPPPPPPPEPAAVPVHGTGRFLWRGVVLMRAALTSGPWVLDEWAPKLLFRNSSSHPADAARSYMEYAGVTETKQKIAVDLISDDGPEPAPDPAADAA